MAPEIDILIPTFDRPAALAVTLTSLLAQSAPFRVVVSDQGEPPAAERGEVRAVARALMAAGHPIEFHRHLPRLGMAEQRQFLLDRARSEWLLYLDDDLILEPGVVPATQEALHSSGAGFAGRAVIGLSYLDDVRPHEQAIEFWKGPVRPERVRPGTAAWQRHRLHNAANLWHVQQRLGLTRIERQRPYRVAWIGGCVMFRASRLRAVGGFGFWRRLPLHHSGEDVLAQLRVMARFGGFGLIPSAVYHQELPTSLPRRDADAPLLLGLDPTADE